MLVRRLLPLCCAAALTAFAQAPSSPPSHAQSAAAAAPAAATMPAYRNARLPIPDRVNDLLRRMTLDEKIEQMVPRQRGASPVFLPTDDAALRRLSPSDLYRLMDGMDLKHAATPTQQAVVHNATERYSVEKTRLGIPAFSLGEALHGFMANGATSFPIPLGMASTWDPQLVQRAYNAAGNEAAAAGVNQVFAPDLDLGRDPRWGRTEETFGEDPYLVSRMGLAEVLGLQGTSARIDRQHVLATIKHFTAHGQPEGGTNTAPVNVSRRELRENFFVPFELAVKQGHPGSLMASYNEIDGIPDHINRWLLTDVLRHEWGFDGYITSDGNGLQDLIYKHHAAANSADAAYLALNAGIEFDLSSGDVFRTLLDQVHSGRVSEAQIDDAVRHILTEKFRLGLFDHPYVDPARAAQVVNSPAHQRLALAAARESITLLRNQDGLLPLSLDQYKTIAVIGPDAAAVHLGGYARQPLHEVSVLDGIRRRVGGRAQVLYAEGCKITSDVTTDTPGWAAWYKNGITLPDPTQQRQEISAAVSTAKKADVVILVIGENESIDREAWSLQHLGDRDSLDLFGDQGQLLSAVLATGKPVVVLLENGRPISDAFLHVPAILEAWFPGQEGGTAAAEILFGDVNPSGKLPITIPHTVGDLPDFYNHKPSDVIPWIFTDRKPLYPFGYGLSYTTFKFANLKVASPTIAPRGTETVTVDVTNTGRRAGVEVAQLYLDERVSPVTRPVEWLRGFQRVALQPGETKTVTFHVGFDDLAQWDENYRHVVRPGVYDVRVGDSSVDQLTAPFTVAEPAATPAAH